MRRRSHSEIRGVRCIGRTDAFSKWIINFESSLSHDCSRAQLLRFDLPSHYVEISLHLVQLKAPLQRVVFDKVLTLTVAMDMPLFHLDLVEDLLDLRALSGVLVDDVILEEVAQDALEIRFGVVKFLNPEEDFGEPD